MYYSTNMGSDESDAVNLQLGPFSQVNCFGVRRIFGRSQEWALHANARYIEDIGGETTNRIRQAGELQDRPGTCQARAGPSLHRNWAGRLPCAADGEIPQHPFCLGTDTVVHVRL